MPDIAAVRAIAELAARELFLGVLKTIENTCRTIYDAVDDPAGDGPCECGLDHDEPGPLPPQLIAAILARSASSAPASDPDRPWVMTSAEKLVGGYDVCTTSGEEFHIVEVGPVTVDPIGNRMISLHVKKPGWAPRAVQVSADTPLLIAPRIPDDLSEVAP